MWLIVGLGNPGPKYAVTRHNIGFMVVDAIARATHAPSFTGKFKGELAQSRIGGEPVALLKPLTFMNLSGESVQPTMAFFKVAPEHLVVIHDDLDLPLGQLRLKKGGGHGGHNGIRDISARIGPEFIRVRAGIGRPERKSQVTSHVLTGFTGDDAELAKILVDDAARAVELVVREGLVAAQHRFHTDPQKAEKAKARAAEKAKAREEGASTTTRPDPPRRE